jgi:hypothetical protein
MEMRKNYILTVLFCLMFPVYVFSQSRPAGIKAQVLERFEYPLYQETFDSSATEWAVVSNSENMLIMQEGEYILQRKSKLSPFAVIGEFDQPFSNFRFVTSLKLVKSNDQDGSIGCVFMAQPGGKGGFIFEINQQQQYRLRQISGSGYEYLTGNPKDGGWSKTSLLKPINMANLFEVRTFDKKYDLYLNNNILLSFSEIAYNEGDLGFIIGPGAMGKIDFVYIFTNDKNLAEAQQEGKAKEDNSNENDLIALAESIIDLKSQLNKLQEENSDLRERMDSFKGMEMEQIKMKAGYETRVAQLEKKIKQKDASFDSLQLINADLNKYKEMVKGNESGDVVISLSKNLKAEKLRADELTKQNTSLKDSIRTLNAIIKNEPIGKSKTDNKNSSKPVEDKNTFVLPKEN